MPLPVNVGHEVHVESLLRVGLQRLQDAERRQRAAKQGKRKKLSDLSNHDGAEIRAANADVDNVSDRLARVAFPLALQPGGHATARRRIKSTRSNMAYRAHCRGKLLDLRQDLVDVGHDILVLDEDGLVGAVAQRDVQHLTTRERSAFVHSSASARTGRFSVKLISSPLNICTHKAGQPTPKRGKRSPCRSRKPDRFP